MSDSASVSITISCWGQATVVKSQRSNYKNQTMNHDSFLQGKIMKKIFEITLASSRVTTKLIISSLTQSTLIRFGLDTVNVKLILLGWSNVWWLKRIPDCQVISATVFCCSLCMMIETKVTKIIKVHNPSILKLQTGTSKNNLTQSVLSAKLRLKMFHVKMMFNYIIMSTLQNAL